MPGVSPSHITRGAREPGTGTVARRKARGKGAEVALHPGEDAARGVGGVGGEQEGGAGGADETDRAAAAVEGVAHGARFGEVADGDDGGAGSPVASAVSVLVRSSGSSSPARYWRNAARWLGAAAPVVELRGIGVPWLRIGGNAGVAGTSAPSIFLPCHPVNNVPISRESSLWKDHVMAEDTIRTHVVFPKELVIAVDRLAGQRKRSAFVAEAVAEKLEREQLGRALAETAGSLAAEDYPEWETPEMISAWVRKSRAFDNESTNRELARFRSS